MKAILQNFKTGEMSIDDVPPPALKPDGVIVHNVSSLVSAGTEKAVVELAKMNLLQKAKARPDLVNKVLNKAGQEGLLATANIVMNLVSAPLPLGYSCAGFVTQVGSRVTDIRPGQRVACAGLGYANHAEVVYVPRNLIAPIPDAVAFEEAAFVTVGAIALHGVRQAELTLGESVVIIGMGLVGQIAAQICAASGCRTFCIDLDPAKVALAQQLGADAGTIANNPDLLEAVNTFTGGYGADAVLITAATKSHQPVELAAKLVRDRARVVAIGDVGHHIPRRAYYEKEIELRQSRSYGPGRYDPNYEEKGQDYPIGYVRWTENRNMEAFLNLVARRKVQLMPLVTHRYAIEAAKEAYDLLLSEQATSCIGLLLSYEVEKDQAVEITISNVDPQPKKDGSVSLGIIGAGQFAQGILLPALNRISEVNIHSFATGSGLTALNVARKYQAIKCTSDYHTILESQEVDAVIVTTRHNLHSQIVVDALKAGKHCFVEKPLALDEAGLTAVIEAYQDSKVILLTGFNRRFSPLAIRLKETIGGNRLVMNYRINAGSISPDHWHQDDELGGGRIVGEVCHFIDMMQFLCGSEPIEVLANSLTEGVKQPADPDNLTILLRFQDGSIGTITYVSNGDPAFSKERLEVFGGSQVGIIDNWRTLQIQGQGKQIRQKCWLQAEKGHPQEMAAFIAGIRSGQSPIPFDSQVATTRATFAIQQAVRTGGSIPIDLTF